MANQYFGRISELWKHIPLAEALAREDIKVYWDSHAGSALYPLTHSIERDHGIYHLLRSVEKSDVIRGAKYMDVLRGIPNFPHLESCPGGPLVAMSVLGNRATYVFCDLDNDSLEDIERMAGALKLQDKVRTAHADGVATISSESAADSSHVLAFIDPFRPFEKSACGVSPSELCFELARSGCKCIFWYGFGSASERESCWSHFSCPSDKEHPRVQPWIGEIVLETVEKGLPSFDPGVLGCAVVCSNLMETTIAAIVRTGAALAGLYVGYRFPEGASGALSFRHSLQ